MASAQGQSQDGKSEGGGRSRLRNRLLGWFLLFSIVPLFVTNAVGYRRTKSILRDQAELSLVTLAQVQAQHVRAQLDRHLLAMTAITSGNEFLLAGVLQARGHDAGQMGRVASRAAMAEFLRPKLAGLRAFKTLYVYTPDGDVVAAVGDLAATHTRIPWRLDAGPMLTAEVHSNDGSLAPHFHLASPIIRPHGGIAAYLGGTVDMADGNEFLQIPAHLADDVESFLVDSLGLPIFISHPHGKANYHEPLASAALGRNSRPVEEYTDRQGEPVLGTIVQVPGYPWRFVAEVPTAAAYGELRELAQVALALESFFLAILIAFAWLVARGLVRPLQALQRASRRVAHGDLAVRVPDDAPDELGDVGRAFNDMTAALGESQARVKALHDQEIKRAAQLATVGELASGIAHEIKNPVVSVANGLDLVRRRVGADPWLASVTDEMRRQLERIQGAIQELLTFARPSTPTFVTASANAVLRRATRLVEPAANRAGVTIDVVDDPTQPRLQVDEEMVLQALVNLLMNAVEASGSGHTVTASARWIADDVVFEIADTGRGIPASDLETVFRPFYTTRHTGTGLGLPISRGVAEKHGGTLTLSSNEGRGTRAVLRLPVEPSAMPSTHREAQPV